MNTLNFAVIIISTVLIFSMGVFSIISNPQGQLNRAISYILFDILCIIIFFYILYVFPSSRYTIYFLRAYLMFVFLFALFFLYLTFFFPMGGGRLLGYVEILFVSVALFIGGIAGLTELVIDKGFFSQNILIMEFGIVFYIFFGAAFTAIIAGLINLSVKLVQSGAYAVKIKVLYFILGSVLGGGFTVMAVYIFPQNYEFTGLLHYGHPIGAVLFAGTLILTSTSRGVLELPSLLSRSVMYLLLFITGSAPVFAIIFMYFGKYWIVGEMPAFIIATSMVAVFLAVNYFVHPWIVDLFSMRLRRFDRQIDRFLKETEKQTSGEYIIQRTADILFDGLGLSKVFFLWFVDKTRKYELFYYRTSSEGEELKIEPVDRSAVIIRWFVRSHSALGKDSILIETGDIESVREELVSFYDANGVEMILPIYHERMLYGLICLGPKTRSLVFSPDEIDKVSLFHEKCNDIISTNFFFQKSMKEQFVRRTKELSSDILAKSLPGGLPTLGYIRFGSFIIPRYEEGADYFDFINSGDRGVGMLATDVSGVGINSALYSVMLRSAFQACIMEAPLTSGVIQTLNRVVYDYTGGKGNLITAYYFFYDYENMRLMFTNAGFPPLEVFRVSRSDFDTLDTEGIPLGFDGTAAYGTGRTNVSKDDIGVLYSKSFLSSKNEAGNDYGLVRLRSMVRENRTRRPSEIAEAIYRSYRDHMGTSLPESDVFVLIFKIS